MVELPLPAEPVGGRAVNSLAASVDRREIESLMNRTEPSAINTLTPPEWRLETPAEGWK